MTTQEHYRACVLWMDNDARLYERGVAIATVLRKTEGEDKHNLIDSYADDIVATTNLNEPAHPHMAVDGTQEEVKQLVIERIKEVFKEWDEDFVPLDNAIKENL